LTLPKATLKVFESQNTIVFIGLRIFTQDAYHNIDERYTVLVTCIEVGVGWKVG